MIYKLRDIMKIRGSIMIALFMIGILSCVVMPSANAEIFDIGEEMDSDLKSLGRNYHPYTSGAILFGSDFQNNLTSLIFDGNLSTGIEITNTTSSIRFWIQFPMPLFVTNITFKPYFANGSSNYSVVIYMCDRYADYIYLWHEDTNGEQTSQLNCYIDSIDVRIDRNGTDKFYFNDVIINYISTNQTDVSTSIDFLSNTVNSLQNQINNLNQNITEIKNTMPSEYNDTILANKVFQLESENAALRLEIENHTKDIENLTTEMETLESTEKEIIIEKQPDNNLVYAALGSGILGIIIALVAIILASRKLGSKEPSTTKEEPEDKKNQEEKE
jgi:chaperonin cofactor prefoldin